MTIKREFELSEEEAAYIDAKATETGSSVNDVVRDAIQVAKSNDALLDRWVKEEALPVYERYVAGLEETYSSEEVFAELHRIIDDAAAKKTAAE
jgi:hypothetical protein